MLFHSVYLSLGNVLRNGSVKGKRSVVGEEDPIYTSAAAALRNETLSKDNNRPAACTK